MIIIDNFIQDPQFMEEVQKEEHWETPLPYAWKPHSQEISNMWEDLANSIWGYFNFDFVSEGYEYWTNPFAVGAQEELNWHNDKDEEHWNQTGEIVTPRIGCVWYAHKETPIGGFLQIDRGEGEYERIQAVPNRLVIFDSGSYHSVSPITKESGPRWTFASNLWEKKPMDENFV